MSKIVLNETKVPVSKMLFKNLSIGQAFTHPHSNERYIKIMGYEDENKRRRGSLNVYNWALYWTDENSEVIPLEGALNIIVP